MAERNRQFRLHERPQGRIGPTTFDLVEEDVPELGEGEALVRTEWISLDPTNRAWIEETPTYLPPVGIGEVMRGARARTGRRLQPPELRRGPARPGPDRLAGVRRRLRRRAAAAGARARRACRPSFFLGVLGHDRPDRLGRA